VLNIKNLKGTETEKNLYKTFAVESRTNNIYIMFAEMAKNEGYRWIAEIFETIAGNELAHSRAAYKKYLCQIKETEDNLKFSVDREDNVAELYKEFEKTAASEGLDEIAHFYKELSEAEESHVKIYTDLVNRFKNGGIFYSEQSISWVCMNCGYIHEGKTAPDKCPCCGFSQSYFMPKCNPE
jgi:rubrerythrin